MNIKPNTISILGDAQGGTGGNGSDQNLGSPGGCCSIPTPQGPADTYWSWPPYALSGRSSWYNRHFLAENINIPMGEIQYTLLYIEKLKSEFGGTTSSVWGKRINAAIAPGNLFIEDLIVFGNPLGWKPKWTINSNFPGIKKNSNNTYSTTDAIMTEGELVLNNICKIERAGGYIFEVMRYIINYSFPEPNQPKVKMLADYESFLSSSDFIYTISAPNSTTHYNYIYSNKVYSLVTNPLTDDDGINIIKNYIIKLSKITNSPTYISGWNKLECVSQFEKIPTTTPAPPSVLSATTTAVPRTTDNNNWEDIDSVKQALKDIYFGWGSDGYPIDEIVKFYFPNGWPREIDLNILHPTMGAQALNYNNNQKEIIQQVILINHWVRCRSYYIDICEATKIAIEWIKLTRPNYLFTYSYLPYAGEIDGIDIFNTPMGDYADEDFIARGCVDYVDGGNLILKNAFREEILRDLYQNIFFKRYLVQNYKLLDYITPLAACDTNFNAFTAWFDSYDRFARINTFNGSGSIINDRTAFIDGKLRFRISWELAMPVDNTTINGINTGIFLAKEFGSNITLGPSNITNAPFDRYWGPPPSSNGL